MKVKRNPSKKRARPMHKKYTGVMKLPGEQIFNDLVAGNTPIQEGVYLVYYIPSQSHADSDVMKVSGISIANYSGGRWGLNHKVKAYMGPLPVLSLPALENYQPPYLLNQTFYTSTLEMAAKSNYISGPHACYTLAFLSPGNQDEFIFCVDSDEPNPYPIAKFSTKKKKTGNFIELSEKAKKKYRRMVDILRSKNG